MLHFRLRDAKGKPVTNAVAHLERRPGGPGAECVAEEGPQGQRRPLPPRRPRALPVPLRHERPPGAGHLRGARQPRRRLGPHRAARAAGQGPRPLVRLAVADQRHEPHRLEHSPFQRPAIGGPLGVTRCCEPRRLSGPTRRPPGASRSASGSSTRRLGAAATLIASNGACSGRPEPSRRRRCRSRS